MQPGDEVLVTLKGKAYTVAVDVVNLLNSEKGEFIATADFEGSVIGMNLRYKNSERSDIYEKVLPMGAIHKDMKGYYCLVVQENNGILGKEFVAARINIEIIFSGTQEAAIEGNLGIESQVIVETNTILQEGERVRRMNKAGIRQQSGVWIFAGALAFVVCVIGFTVGSEKAYYYSKDCQGYGIDVALLSSWQEKIDNQS